MDNKFYSIFFATYKFVICGYNFYDWKFGLMVKALAQQFQAFKFNPSLGLNFYCYFSRVRGLVLTRSRDHGD